MIINLYSDLTFYQKIQKNGQKRQIAKNVEISRHVTVTNKSHL